MIRNILYRRKTVQSWGLRDDVEIPAVSWVYNVRQAAMAREEGSVIGKIYVVVVLVR